MQLKFVRLAAPLAALALVAGACGGGGGVGEGLKADGKGNGQNAIGQETTTTAAPIVTTTTATTAKPTVTTAKPPPCHTVTINNDTKGASFADENNNNNINCSAGRYILFINKDDDPTHPYHKLYTEPANPELTSPELRYNQQWEAKVTRRGTFTLKDTERPYAQSFTVTVG
jgi:hypothetical protein